MLGTGDIRNRFLRIVLEIGFLLGIEIVSPFLLLQGRDSVCFDLLGELFFVARGGDFQKGDSSTVIVLSDTGEHVEFEVGLRMIFQYGSNLERAGKGCCFVLITYASVRQVYLDNLSYRVCFSEQFPGS